jgi:hypothetical protein
MRMRVFESSDGIRWGVEVILPGASNALVVFHHPDGGTARLDRYAHYNADRPEARDVTARLSAAKVLESLSDGDLRRLFRRSMRISAADNPLNVPITHDA